MAASDPPTVRQQCVHGGGPGIEKRLPGKDPTGIYHIDGILVVADKAAIKVLISQLGPLLRALKGSCKIFLIPLAK
jgi:hypothetical protein